MTRDLTSAEAEWLFEHYPTGESHSIGGNENLAACIDCEWVAQADSFEYLMEQIGPHLATTLKVVDEEAREIAREEFRASFGWDPWAEGVLNDEDAMSSTVEAMHLEGEVYYKEVDEEEDF